MLSHLIEYHIDDYEPFFAYYTDSNFIIYVNNQSDFEKGLTEIYDDDTTMTEQQAEEARNMKITNRRYIHPDSNTNIRAFKNALEKNGFRLIPKH